LFAYEDAVQECAVIFVNCCRLYEGKVTNGAHFMALFKTAVTNDFNTFALHNRRSELNDAAGATMFVERANIELSNGPLLALLGQASLELRVVLSVIANGPSELLKLMLDWPAIDLRSEVKPAFEAAFSRSLCRLARTNVRSDLLTELRVLLGK
jgi:hypothetical protein